MTNISSFSDDLTRILNLADSDVRVKEIEETADSLIVYVEKAFPNNICPECGCKAESKGPRIRQVNHPILQDGRKCLINLISRKWHCKSCGAYYYDQFGFVEKGKQNSNIIVLQVLDKMKNLGYTAVSIAHDLNISDTMVHEIFMRYVDLPRLPLPEVLCIDEVHMKYSNADLYSVILLDWKTGDVVDILPNRYHDTLVRYFQQITISERENVKYLISDMYSQYTDLAGSLLPEAVSVIDCFHHTQPMINSIRQYINKVRKRYLKRDHERLEEKNFQTNSNHRTIKESREVYLLRRYEFLLLKNVADINYEPYFRSVRGRGGYLFDLRAIEKEFMELDENFPKIRELKEMYIAFTHSYVNDREGAEKELEHLIKIYTESGLEIFTSFARLLTSHKEGILTSFTFMTAERKDASEETLRRLSNGPMEGYNNQPKDLKRNSNSVSNFSYNRNRLLWASRKNPAMKAVPYSREEVHTPGKARGKYKK